MRVALAASVTPWSTINMTDSEEDVDAQVCCICMDAIRTGGGLRLGCEHVFHPDCILTWAQSDSPSHGQCPVCRFESSGTQFTSESTPYFNYCDRRRFERARRMVDIAAGSMDAAERAVYNLLSNDVARAQSRMDTANEAEKAFRKEHKPVFDRLRQLERTTRRGRTAVYQARRTLLSQFPCTSIVVYRERPARQPRATVVRRSARLARAGSTEGEEDHT